MSNKSKIIVVTGAESTGKSTLTKALAAHFNAPFIPEYARHYIHKLKRNYTYQDLEIIAQKQIEQLNKLQKKQYPIVILDTWLLITKVWFDVVYGKIPQWLLQEIENTKIDLFLVCQTNLPWKKDSVRENGGEKRNLLQKRYIEEIEKYNFNYKIIDKINDERTNAAIQFISEIK